MLENKVKNSTFRLEKGDLTAMEVEAIVFYASHDLKLGSGFGSAISARGGIKIQEELKPLAPVKTCDAVVSGAGQLNSKYIIHSVGPRFQESNTEEKLKTTIQNTLKAAEEKGIKEIAFPPMGTGFYGIPLDVCSQIMIETINSKLENNTTLEKVIICVLDNREYRAFEANWKIKN